MKLQLQLLMALFTLFTLAGSVAAADCTPNTILDPLTDDLTSNRFDGVPRGTLQLSAFYDGNGTATLNAQLAAVDDPSDVVWATLELENFGVEIGTGEFDTGGRRLTGLFRIDGTSPNGVVDGVGFGAYWKNDRGRYFVLQSRSVEEVTQSTFVGSWPLGLSDAVVTNLTPQISDSFAREQVRMMLYGANLLGDGCYYIPVAPTVALNF